MAKRTPHSTLSIDLSAPKRPFDIDLAMARIEAAVAPFPKAALFELAERGHTSAFEQLVACIVSIRTRDEVMLPTVLRLFEAAPTPAAMYRLGAEQIDVLIATCPFHAGKARQIHAIAQRVVDEYEGILPCDAEVLLSLHGVGPKCANLVLGIACGQPFIGVDIHVHRIVNRWGYVDASTPEKTMTALMDKLPREYWVKINKLLVPFGKNICTGPLPKCSTCPVVEMCRRVGVGEHR